MKILVTGGAGFIGSNFIHYWLKNHPEDQVINLDALTYAGHLQSLKDVEDNPNYQFIQGDITDLEDVRKAMDGVDIVIHFAAESHVDRSIIDPLKFVKTNVLGTAQLLETAVDVKVKRFHHVSCYDQKTRAFTKSGLKFFWELSNRDKVLSLNLRTNEIEWKKVSKVIIQDYEGPMIKVKSDRVDFLVTPNHRMLLQTKRNNLLFKEARSLGARNRLPKGTWKGKGKLDKDLMYIVGFFIGDGFLAYQEKENPNLTGLTKKEYLALARDRHTGQFIQVGRVGILTKSITRTYRIFLDVPASDSARERVENTLTNLGINWHAQKGKAGEHLYFSSKILSDVFKDCGKGAKNKRIPRWALETNEDSLRSLFDGLIDSDGSKTYNAMRFSTSSWKLAEDFSELCIKLGFTPHIFIRKPTSNYYKGRLISGGINYFITVAKTRRSIIPRYGLNHVETTNYEGKIWCVKVPKNKNLLVERNGIFAFCGNTDEIFGQLGPNDPPFNEQTPYAPRTPYAASKAGSDHLVRAYYQTYGLPITITNCSNNFGPYQDPEKLISRFITNLIEGEKVPLMGQGENIRDWLYVDDHSRAIETVLQKGVVGETYCVGGEEKTNLEVTRKILELLGKDDSFIEHVAHRLGHDFRYAIDDSKLRQLGWKPEHDFETWLKKTVEWYKENEWWWKPLKVGRPNVDRTAQKGYEK